MNPKFLQPARLNLGQLSNPPGSSGGTTMSDQQRQPSISPVLHANLASTPPGIVGHQGIPIVPMDTTSNIPSPNSVDFIRDLVITRRKENGFDVDHMKKLQGMVKHSFKPVNACDLVRRTDKDLLQHDAKTVAICDLVPTLQLRGLSGNLKAKGILQFVILERQNRVDGIWILPTIPRFHDLMNKVQCQILRGLSLIHI